MRTRVSGFVAVMVATVLWLTVGGALLAAAQASSPVGGGSSPTSTTTCQTVNGACVYTISGRVYLDMNANGVKDAGEVDISGVDVDLYAGSAAVGVPIQSTTTASPYVFSQLVAGTYTVVVDQNDLPADCEPVSDFDGGTWGTATVVITQSGELFADFGCTQIVSGQLAFSGGSQGLLAIVGAVMMTLGAGVFTRRRRITTLV